MNRNSSLPYGLILGLLCAAILSVYFVFAAIQGDHGLLHRAELQEELLHLQNEHTRIERDVAELENLTFRLSDKYLDLDLLDQQARDVLGMLRSDEIVIR